MLNDYDLQALIDHQLQPDEERRVKKIVFASPLLRGRYDDLCKQRDALKQWWARQIKN